MSPPDAARFTVNGIDAETGEYLLPPLDAATAATLAQHDPTDRAVAGWLRERRAREREAKLGLPADVDPEDVARAGWAVVYHEDESEEVRRALDPLVEHRRAMHGARVRELEYCMGETPRAWLVRHGTTIASVDPTKVPYYLLIVGEPSRIPYTFQYLLDSEYAVGRVAFPTVEEYKRYARSVVAHETGDVPRHGRTAVFFGTRHDGDRATEQSADHLVRPLATGYDGTPAVAEAAGWQTKLLLGERATLRNLRAVLRGDEAGRPYGLCFTATHGVGFRRGDARQRDRQGALVCQDWAGPGHAARGAYLAADGVPADARVSGLVAFHFACYAAGTPERDDFLIDEGGAPTQVAEQPFVARLPQALLGHPAGGALAVIGHVERAWGCSFLPDGDRPQVQPFRNTLAWILAGQPVGHCLRDLRSLYRSLSTELTAMLDEIRYGATYSDDHLTLRWLARNDARNYTLVGDPAVQLRG